VVAKSPVTASSAILALASGPEGGAPGAGAVLEVGAGVDVASAAFAPAIDMKLPASKPAVSSPEAAMIFLFMFSS
jgi:hypothetical protein